MSLSYTLGLPQYYAHLTVTKDLTSQASVTGTIKEYGPEKDPNVDKIGKLN